VPAGSRGFLNLPNLPNLPNFTSSSTPSSKQENTAEKRATQVIRTQRTIPYPPAKVFELVADVNNYKAFVPYCQESTVTAWTPAVDRDKRWPAQADLTVGWGPFTESYTSKLRCEPQNGIVEAISGNVDGQNQRLGVAGAGQKAASAGVFESLRTTWTVTPAAAPKATHDRRRSQGIPSTALDKREWSDVKLEVSFRFGNAAYGVVMDNFGAPLVETMINAFEKRAKKLYG
jgi:coenzyme Q-binding protein COQ10